MQHCLSYQTLTVTRCKLPRAAVMKEAQALIEKQYQKLERQARPRPPVSSFALFLKSNYARFVEAVPASEGQTQRQRVGLISAEAARQWKALSEDEKQVYRTEYQKARSAYDLQVAKYEQSDMFRPKRASSGFALFVQDSWQQSSEPAQTAGSRSSANNRLAQVAQQWQALSPEEKQRYNDKYSSLKKEYDERTQRYLQAREAQRESVLAQLPARFRNAIQRSLGAAPETIELVVPSADASEPPKQKQ